MTSITQSITQTTSNVLGTISTVANTASRTVTTIASSLDMLDTYVSAAKEKQQARTAVDMHNFYEVLHKEAALENAMREEALEKELQKNSNLKKHYDDQFSKLETIIKSVQTKNNPE